MIASLGLWFGLHLFAGRSPADAVFIAAVAVLSWLALDRGRWPVLAVVLAAGTAGAVRSAIGA